MLTKDVSKQQLIQLQVTDGLTVAVLPDANQEWLMSTEFVAQGYGVSPNTIRGHKYSNKAELKDGVHYINLSESQTASVCFSNAGRGGTPTTVWTKAGVIRLGFFIKSERAVAFRDWAEKIILKMDAPAVNLPKAKRVNHNRLTAARLLKVVSMVALVDDRQLRVALLDELLPDELKEGVQLQLPFGIQTKGGAK